MQPQIIRVSPAKTPVGQYHERTEPLIQNQTFSQTPIPFSSFTNNCCLNPCNRFDAPLNFEPPMMSQEKEGTLSDNENDGLQNRETNGVHKNSHE